jgi:CheY-like chemotaxis protein
MRGRFRLWHLEDDANDRFFVARALAALHPDVELRSFADGLLAQARLNTVKDARAELPHLILTDMKMPGMNGVEFIRWLRRSEHSCVPVVMLSGSALSEDIATAYRAGVSSFITKPLETNALNTVLWNLLNYWKDTCHNPVDHLAEHSCRAEHAR